jgi:putative tryptophan/tyrosine transport system substrate-binding protein
MLALTDAALAHLCVAATAIHPRARSSWLREIAAKLDPPRIPANLRGDADREPAKQMVGRYEQLPGMATELVARRVAVIAATGGEPSGLAAKAATETIPIVCTLGGDAVDAGLVAHLNRPGGNVTGVTIIGVEIGPKRVELAHQLVPNASALAMLINSKFPLALRELREMQTAARSLGLQVSVLDASTGANIGKAFATVARGKVGDLSPF